MASEAEKKDEAKTEGPKTTVPVPTTPSTGMTPVLATGGLLALGGGAIYALHRWRRSRVLEASGGESLPQGTETGPAAAKDPAPEPTSEPPRSGASPDFGPTSRGAEYRELLRRIEEVSRMPIAVFLSVVANRESGWSRTARNKDKVEAAASRRAIEAGPSRGNPAPKFSSSIAEAGSGGLFGALAPYVAWTGLDEGFTPYLDADYTIVEDPVVAAICAAKYYQRVVAFYPTVFARPGSPVPEDNYRVRLGWASPKTLREDPAGKLFGDVKRRMDEDLKALGLAISDLPPPSAASWPGLKAVVEGMKGFSGSWK